MGKNDIFNINVLEFTPPIINSRDCIKNLKKEILKSPNNKVILNFGNIKSVSRSAAQELMNIKDEFNKEWFHKKILSFSNINKEVSKTFKLVSFNYIPTIPKTKINHKIADIWSFMC